MHAGCLAGGTLRNGAIKGIKNHWFFECRKTIPSKLSESPQPNMTVCSASSALSSRPSRCLSHSCCIDGARASAGRRLTHAFQQFFEHHRVVVSLVPGGKQQRS